MDATAISSLDQLQYDEDDRLSSHFVLGYGDSRAINGVTSRTWLDFSPLRSIFVYRSFREMEKNFGRSSRGWMVFRLMFKSIMLVIFAAGTGNPFFTTDSAASLRAIEINAELLIKATKVDGVYSADPTKDSTAERYDVLDFDEVLERKLGVMDATAIALCQEHAKPILVFNFKRDGNIVKAISGDTVGTWIGPKI